MRLLFADLPEACDNTLVIAQRCAYMPEPRKPILPPFPTDERPRGGGRAARHGAAPGSKQRLERSSLSRRA